MIYLNPNSLIDNEYDANLFGANILSSRDQIGEDGTYDEAAEALGVTHIRYPGGSLTEDYFDLADPDKDSEVDPDTGKTVGLLPYSDFMSYAEENNFDVTIVIPTRNYLSEATDSEGHRYADIDEDVLRGFIQDTLSGQYGSPNILAFEIGNEYWGSGEMDSLEYGRVSSRMAEILNDELGNNQDIDILVQNGQNYGSANLENDYDHLSTAEAQVAAIEEDYGIELGDDIITGAGKVSWPRVANEIILSEFDTASEIEAVDGLAAHIYSKGADNPNSREYDLNVIESTWGEQFEDLDTYITEWNLRASRNWDVEEQYGLRQAHEMLNMSETFVENGVDAAHVWAIQQNNLTNLAGNEGGDGELTVGGEMFRMMAESLVGTQPVEFDTEDRYDFEATEEDTSVHGFYDDNRFVMFIASNVEENQETVIDLSQIITNPGNMSVEVLGVADGDNPTSPDATAEVTELNPSQVYSDGQITADLEGFEILRVVMEGARFTRDFMNMVNDISDEADDEDPLMIPDTSGRSDVNAPTIEEDDDEDDGLHDAGDSDGGMGGGLGMLALLPLLALFGM